VPKAESARIGHRRRSCGLEAPGLTRESREHCLEQLPEHSSLILIPMEVVNESGVVVEALPHPINGKYGGADHGKQSCQPCEWFFLQAHTDLSLHLTENACAQSD
jgi:hypothetical protein